jgi:hypothetical protein
MNKEPKIHKAMTDDGVGNEADVYRAKIRTEPAVSGVSCDERKEQVRGDSTDESTNYAGA